MSQTAPPVRRLIDPIPQAFRPSEKFAQQRLLLAQKAGLFKGTMPAPGGAAAMWRGISPSILQAANAAGASAHPMDWLAQLAKLRPRIPAEDFNPFPDGPAVDPGFDMGRNRDLLVGLIAATKRPDYSHQDALMQRFLGR